MKNTEFGQNNVKPKPGFTYAKVKDDSEVINNQLASQWAKIKKG